MDSSKRRTRSEQNKDAVVIDEPGRKISTRPIDRKAPNEIEFLALKQDLVIADIHGKDGCRSFGAANSLFRKIDPKERRGPHIGGSPLRAILPRDTTQT